MKKPLKPPVIAIDQFTTFQRAGLTLMPLRKWNAKTKDGEPAGKMPLKGWPHNPYKAATVIADAKSKGNNVGFRIGDGWLVLDFDVRNSFGDDELELVCRKFGIDRDACPEVITGSDGRHLYLRIPKGFKVRNTVPGLESVECKALGRYVVAPGSIHPNGRPYRWVKDRPALADAPAAPKALLDTIARPVPVAAFADFVLDSARIEPAQLAAMLASVPVEDFGTNDAWEPLMMAAHHATGGAGLAEFIEWSIGDPAFADAAPAIETRWNSLDADKIGGRTFRTLQSIVAQYNPNATVAGDAAADFKGAPIGPEHENDVDEEPSEDAWLDGDTEEAREQKAWLDQLNEKYCAVTTGGKYRIMYQAQNAKGPDWEWTSKTDFLSLHENQKVVDPHNPDKVVPLGQGWQQWPRRRTASGTTFDASLEAGALDANNNLNLWLGWAIEPKPGKWTRFEAMIRDDVCGGETKAAEYFFNWAAWKFQHPGELPEAAFAMRGNKGTGKGTVGEAFVNIYGNHAIATASMEHVFGRFNGHMERILFAFADEAFWAGDPRQDARLKKLVTDKDSMFEHKNIQPYPGINRTAVMLATNDDWVVPASEGERRYCVVRTSDKHQCPEGEPNHPNRPYWDAIYAELRSGGLAAFLHAMLARKLPSGWHPRAHVPLTQELANQKARSLKGIVGFYFERLQTGVLTETLTGTSQDWNNGELRVSPSEFWEACRDWIHATNPRATVTRRGVSTELKRFGWGVGEHLQHGKNRDRYWSCPALEDARGRFEEVLKGRMFD